MAAPDLIKGMLQCTARSSNGCVAGWACSAIWDENADGEQLKAILTPEIIRVLDRERLSVRAAHDRTGVAAADFSRIRNADLRRFTVDRLMSIINRLGSRIDVKIRVRRAEKVA